jgi:hypothetical protein
MYFAIVITLCKLKLNRYNGETLYHTLLQQHALYQHTMDIARMYCNMEVKSCHPTSRQESC